MNYTLREIELSDIETVNSWRSDPELIGHLLAPFRYISPETDKRWYDDYMAKHPCSAYICRRGSRWTMARAS